MYRLAKSAPPTREDFIPLFLKPHKPFAHLQEECRACGLSVHREPAESQKLQRVVPGFRTAIIVSAVLDSEHGVIKATPTGSSHHTWWVPDGMDASSLEWVINRG